MKVPRMSRVERRQLIRLGRRSGDPDTPCGFRPLRGWRQGAARHRSPMSWTSRRRRWSAPRIGSSPMASTGCYDRRRGNGTTQDR